MSKRYFLFIFLNIFNRLFLKIIELLYRSVKSNKRKEQKSLLKKIQTANEKISNLENALSQAHDDAKSQSSKVRYLYFYINL